MTITQMPVLGSDVRQVSDINPVVLDARYFGVRVYLCNCPGLVMFPPTSTTISGDTMQSAPLTRIANKRSSGSVGVYQVDTINIVVTLAAPGNWAEIYWNGTAWAVLCQG